MEGSPNDIRGNGHRRTRIDDHWQRKTGGGIGEKKSGTHHRAALGIYTTILIVLLWVTGSLRP